jgi:GT2 family glycosyltransferase
MRPDAILKLMQSVREQSLYPHEIHVVDGSTNRATRTLLEAHTFRNLNYVKVDQKDRGLTKQRNIGVGLVSKTIDVVCFLDDDTVLDVDYFKHVMATFRDGSIVGVGGVAVNENRWFKPEKGAVLNSKLYYELEGYAIKESSRNVLRKRFGLQSPLPPGMMPSFSNGRTYSYPLNDKIYAVDLLVGMSFSFRKSVFDALKFSTYFEGYGLYEDADFSLRALKYGKNVINTAAKLEHYHEPLGRPNTYKYGKMVLRNGWYVWRIKYNTPSFKSKIKWHATALLLTLVRLTNVVTTKQRKEAFMEALGRFVGWGSLLFNKPKVEL